MQADLVGSTEYIIQTIETGPCRVELGHRYGAPPGQPAGRRASRQDHQFPLPHGLHVRDHVSDRPAPPGVVSREPGAGNAREPDQSRSPRRRAGLASLERMLALRRGCSAPASEFTPSQYLLRSLGLAAKSPRSRRSRASLPLWPSRAISRLRLDLATRLQDGEWRLSMRALTTRLRGV